MAYTKETNTAAATAASTTDNKWKAAGYINIYLPTKGGADRKVGAIKLLARMPREKALSDWLNADPKNVEAFAKQLVVVFNSGEASPDSEFDLPGLGE